MQKVTVNGITLDLLEAPSDTIELAYGDMDKAYKFPILSVSAKATDELGNLYKVIWYLDHQDGQNVPADVSDWVNDWATADAMELLEEVEQSDPVGDAWDELEESGISEQTLRVVTNINGYTLEALRDVLYSEFGERVFEFEEGAN